MISKLSEPGAANANTPSDVIRQIQFSIDHPSLEKDVGKLKTEELAILRADVEFCRALLERAGRGPVEAIGAGSFGIVFRGVDPRLQRTIAIKILRPSYHPRPNIRSRFALEAESLAKCELPGIIPVYEAGEIEGIPFIVTQFIDGPNLAQYLEARKTPLPVAQAVRFVISVANAVQAMHERAFIHRDLKPSNILLEKQDETELSELYRPIVTDFGFVKEIAAQTADHSVLDPVVGTIRYMAPEQALGKANEISTKTDIHALGAILVELLCKKPPFSDGEKLEILHKIAYDAPPKLRDLRPDCSRTLEAIVDRALAKLPSDRYSTMAEFAGDLKAFLEDKPTLAQPAGPARKLYLAAKRHKLLTASWFLLLGALVVIAVSYWKQLQANRVADSSVKLAVEAMRDIQRKAEAKWRQPGQMLDRLELQQLACAKFQKLAEQRNFDAYSRHQLSIAFHYLSNAEATVDLRKEAIRHRSQALALLNDLVVDDPNNITYHYDLFMNHLLMGHLINTTERHVEYDLALREIEFVSKSKPDNPDYQDARNALNIALAREFMVGLEQDKARARSLCEAAMKSSASLAKQYPNKPLYGKYVSHGHQILGGLAAMNGDIAKFKEEYQFAIKAHQELAQRFGDQSDQAKLGQRGDLLHEEWILRIGLIETLRKNACHQEVIDETLACLPVYEALARWFPEQRHRIWDYAEAKTWLSIAYAKTGQNAEAKAWLEKAQADCATAPVPEGYLARTELVRAALAEAEMLLNQTR